MKRFLSAALVAAFVLSFPLHSRMHASDTDRGPHVCRVCSLGNAQHAAPAPSDFGVRLVPLHALEIGEAVGLSPESTCRAFPRAPPPC
ncbi:MAG TPA: hypothetical protein P5079_07135 [Elusimicrobiota bacterium]|nr:hypothetical protein [Elusimicrobiota bacterium]